VSAPNADHLIFISGASSGIGRAMIETLPYANARVLNLSRRPAPGSEHVALDLSDPASWPTAEARFRGALDSFAGERVTFVHSAGVLTPIRFAGEGDPAAEIQNVLLNSAAPQALGHAFLRALSGCDPEPRSTLLFTGSGASSAAYMGWSGYCAGKAATDHFTRTVGAELDRRGRPCRVLCVAPGIVQTAMQAEIRDTPVRDFPEVARFIELHDGGSLRTPKEVAGELWALLEREHSNGAVLDLREA
jgi:NAD(P)-dependent dehydrogenase (short-subunit alcohol dehydrogenase family)